MSLYLDTRGNSSAGIALCDRCRRKFPIGELYSDPNFPGLKVCSEDLDVIDPYRLAPRTPDNITLPFVRPEESIETAPSGLIGEDENIFIVTDDGEGFILP